MKSNNNHKPITHVALPERQMPILVSANGAKAEGYAPATAWGNASPIGVRRVLPNIVLEAIRNASGRAQFQTDYGKVPDETWKELIEMIERIDWVNAGGTGPIIKTSNQEASSQRKGKSLHLAISFDVTAMTPAYAISEAFTKGFVGSRIVVWWSTVAKKLVIGLYCPDASTSLFASVLSGFGTPGGIGVCRKCRFPFLRARAKQVYCGHKCQVAEGMKRYRNNLERNGAGAKRAPVAKKKGRK